MMRRPIVLGALLAVAGAWAGGDDARPRGLLIVTNKGDQTLGIIDPVLGKQVATVKQSGVTGHELVASPDGRTAYVPIYGDSGVGRPGSDGRTVDVIDLASRRIVATIDLGRPERPHDPKFGSDGRLYVTTELTNSVTVIDPRTNQVVDRLPTDQPESHMLLVSRDGRRAYTSNVHAGTVSAIDVASKKVKAVIPVAKMGQRLAFSADEKWVFTADQHEPRLIVIDAATNQVARSVALPGIAYGTAATIDGRHLVLALIKSNQVARLDLATWTVGPTLDVPKAPQEVLVRPDGKVAYVSCDASGKVAEIDLEQWKVARLIDAGPMVDGLAWAAADPSHR
jgi:YVTN family beta-propeller protein